MHCFQVCLVNSLVFFCVNSQNLLTRGMSFPKLLCRVSFTATVITLSFHACRTYEGSFNGTLNSEVTKETKGKKVL